MCPRSVLCSALCSEVVDIVVFCKARYWHIFCRFKLRGVSRPLSTYTDWYKTLMYTFNNITLYILPGVAWQVGHFGFSQSSSVLTVCLRSRSSPKDHGCTVAQRCVFIHVMVRHFSRQKLLLCWSSLSMVYYQLWSSTFYFFSGINLITRTGGSTSTFTLSITNITHRSCSSRSTPTLPKSSLSLSSPCLFPSLWGRTRSLSGRGWSWVCNSRWMHTRGMSCPLVLTRSSRSSGWVVRYITTYTTSGLALISSHFSRGRISGAVRIIDSLPSAKEPVKKRVRNPRKSREQQIRVFGFRWCEMRSCPVCLAIVVRGPLGLRFYFTDLSSSSSSCSVEIPFWNTNNNKDHKW